MSIKKYIGDKKFYKTVLAIAVPMMIQNGFTNLVNLPDNVMVGRLGTESMSGVSIVNQFIFIFNLLIFGAISAAGIFTALNIHWLFIICQGVEAAKFLLGAILLKKGNWAAQLVGKEE